MLGKPPKEERTELLGLFLRDVPNDVLGNEKKMKYLVQALDGFSHADIKTVVNNAARSSIVNSCLLIDSYDLLKEVYFYRNHTIGANKCFVEFLRSNGETQYEIKEKMGVSLRKIRELEKMRV
jgi:AAA+ superfamily predicted ATPase